jgi:hypothetical protein
MGAGGVMQRSRPPCSCRSPSLAAGCGGAGDGAREATASTGSAGPSPSPWYPGRTGPIDGEYTMTLTRQDVLDAGFRGARPN